MKILVNNYETKDVTCKHCTSLIEVTQGDIKEAGGMDKLVCPCCGKLMIGEPEKELIPVEVSTVNLFEKEVHALVETTKQSCKNETLYICNQEGFFIPDNRFFKLKESIIIGMGELTLDKTQKCSMDLWEFYTQVSELSRLNGREVPTLEETRHILEKLGYEHDSYLDVFWGLSLRNNVINSDGTVTHPHKSHGSHAPHFVQGYQRKDGTFVRSYWTGA